MADDDEIHYTTVRTVLGSSRREQRWDLTHEVSISTVLGKSFFDLRNARPMGDEDVEISITCFLGSVELLVPVGTRVTLEGSTFLAGASSDVSGEEDVRSTSPDGVDLVVKPLPRLDISANAVLGRVRVRTPDRPKRARTSRRDKKKRAQSESSRSVADILAETAPLTRQPIVTPLMAAEAASAAQPVPQALRGSSSAPAPSSTPSTGPSTARAPSHTSGPVDTEIATSSNDDAPVDAEIARSVASAGGAGPVDVTFVRSEPDPEPMPSLDDFDPEDFPDDSALVG